MNGYELHIQGTDGIWRQADLGGEIPVMNYQVNDIAELKDRQAEYSQALKLPKTPNNVRIFEHADCFDIVTGFPYRRHNCRIYCDERTVAGDGSLLLLQKVSDTFECQIISGNANFFETLQNTKMSGLDLGTYRICNASANPDAWHPAYKLAFSLDIVPDSYPDLYADHIYKYISSPFVKYPVVSIAYILNQIMQINGYTFESNINNWSNKYLSINSADVEPSVDSANIFQGIAKTSGVSTVNGVQYFTWNIQKDADSNLVLSSGRVYRPGISLFLFGPKTITITIRKTVDGGIANAGTTATFYIKYANEDVGTPWTIGVTEINAQVTHKFDAEGKTRSISIYAVINGTIISGCNFEVRVDFSDILPTNAGGVLVLSNRLGFETQFDFMKFFGQAFGLTFVVDEKTKHVSAYSLELLYDNIESGNVKDWSDKINGKDLSFGFTLKDYAQNNTIALQDSKDGITDSGEFQIDNDTLKYSKELFKLPVEAGKDITLNSGRGSQVACAMIPLVELKTVEESEFERGNELDYIHTITGATFPTVKPHLLELSEQTAEVTFVGELVNLQIAKHVKAQQIVDTGYSALKDRMLKNARMIEENLYLTPGDIERFDPSVPVYLEKYGYYFYVNKIKNFVAGKPTKVELIKL